MNNNTAVLHPEDICLWPDNVWCLRQHLAQYNKKSADFDVIPFGSDRYHEMLGSEARAGFGMLAELAFHVKLPLSILKSNAGFYIGTADHEGPCSRESNEYFSEREHAEFAFETGKWTQKTSL